MLDAVVYIWALAWINKDVAQKRGISNEADIHPNKKRDANQTHTGWSDAESKGPHSRGMPERATRWGIESKL
ncbi:hypothetical protein BDZ89DRAFT_1055722 [Hymenopellis radicata]|nr:hypothetical protein BDZ89DRAFT_1055722 [Hymenopellis radicata]